MKRPNWIWLAGALLAILGAFAVFSFVDATFELGMLHSTWLIRCVMRERTYDKAR
jgi:hypothetical protein